MSYAVVFLHQAELDLEELKSYVIKNFSQDTWKESYARIKKSVLSLKKFPYSGHVPDEMKSLNLDQYRQVISGMNRIIYEVRQNTLYIHIVCDARREMRSLLTRRLLRMT